MSEIAQQIRRAALGAITVQDAALRRDYLFTEGFAGFAGHFPNLPILPAVVQILTVVSLVGEHLGVSQRLVAVEDAKFLTPVRPNQVLQVNCRARTVRGKYLYEAQLTVQEKPAAIFLLELAALGEAA